MEELQNRYHLPTVAAWVRGYAARTGVPALPQALLEPPLNKMKDVLTGLFQRAGCGKLHFDGVGGHLFLVAATEKRKD